MGQLLHGSAAVIRGLIQQSEESVEQLAKRYDLNVKMVRKWKNRNTVEDAPRGPKLIHSKRGNRLSIIPVSAAEWRVIISLV